jgi:hypothetical protein
MIDISYPEHRPRWRWLDKYTRCDSGSGDDDVTLCPVNETVSNIAISGSDIGTELRSELRK